MIARCSGGRCGGAGAERGELGGTGGAEHEREQAVAHQSRVPRALLLVPGGDPIHAHHFAKQILILPLVALLFLAGG